ncbi:MAG TPA: sulfotransferase [Bradyrhizobium sp.]|uniref:tetratricopeptide repeat-containing sulfotransferase family protein n=1 Tax=Bradyrhizobium sp. TaxID=376 RepID=UPI002BD12BAF|nr:sulfotransferase [Bradyrhizobium sp.]HTB04519.1 sulfotransferase [Bradyrhizobium sp.]
MSNSRDSTAGTDAAAEIPVTLSLSLDQALALAEQHLQAGRLPAAEALCRDILRARPEYAPVLHLLGVVTYQAGNLQAAIDLMRRATMADGTVALYHCNLGEMYRLAAQRDAALAAGRRALAIDPNMPQALNNVGIVHYERDEFDDAVAHYRRAIARAPSYAEAHSNLGNALRAQHKFDEALTAYRQARQLRPAYVEAINNMGTALRDMGRAAEAEATYRQALALQPDDPSVLNNLALALKEAERFDEASALLTRSLSLDPGRAKTSTYLALVRLDQKLFPEAEAAAQRALALAPDDPEALNAMGLVRFEQQRSDEALALHRRAVELKPDLADAYNNIGNILKENGELAAARAAFERAIEFDPREAGYYFNLADAKKFTEGDVHLAAMEQRVRNPDGLSAGARSRLDFALAKAYDDLGRYDEAFASMHEGNALKRGRIDYDEAGTLGLFDRIRSTFDPSLLAAGASSGYASTLPVFVVGMPRSGTTLVEQILASHPAAHGAGELNDFNVLVDRMAGSRGNAFRYPEDSPALTTDQLRALGQAYVDGLRRRAPSAERVTDKMPANFLFLGLIHLALPGARIIHVLRDPPDTCLSCYSKLFTAEQNFTYDLGELGRYYRKYAELMAHWRAVMPEGRMLEIRYEDVISDLEGSARQLIEHCGLDWDPSCIAFHKSQRPVRTASAAQVRRPIYRTSLGRWRAYEPHLAPLLAELGVLATPRGEAD